MNFTALQHKTHVDGELKLTTILVALDAIHTVEQIHDDPPECWVTVTGGTLTVVGTLAEVAAKFGCIYPDTATPPMLDVSGLE